MTDETLIKIANGLRHKHVVVRGRLIKAQKDLTGSVTDVRVNADKQIIAISVISDNYGNDSAWPTITLSASPDEGEMMKDLQDIVIL